MLSETKRRSDCHTSVIYIKEEIKNVYRQTPATRGQRYA